MDAHQTMMATLYEYKQHLGDQKYLRLCNELKACREQTKVFYRLTYRHTKVTAVAYFADDELLTKEWMRMVDHTTVCQLNNARANPDGLFRGLRQIHTTGIIRQDQVNHIERMIDTKGFASFSIDDVGNGPVEQIMIVKCEQI